MSELKLEVGKTYLNRVGDTVTIVRYNGYNKPYGYICDREYSYTEKWAI